MEKERNFEMKNGIKNIEMKKELFNEADLTTDHFKAILKRFLTNKAIGGAIEELNNMIPKRIRDMPEFKKVVIEYAKQNPAEARIGLLIDYDFPFFTDSALLEDREFMEKVARKYYGKDAYDRISVEVHSKMEKELEDENFLNERLDYVEKLVKETSEPGILAGLIKTIPEEHLKNLGIIDRLLTISTDQNVIKDLLLIARGKTKLFEEPEFLNKILAVSTDKENIKIVLSGMSDEDKLNPEIMLGIIKVCPNALEIFQENNWDKKERRNLFRELTRKRRISKRLV